MRFIPITDIKRSVELRVWKKTKKKHGFPPGSQAKNPPVKLGKDRKQYNYLPLSWITHGLLLFDNSTRGDLLRWEPKKNHIILLNHLKKIDQKANHAHFLSLVDINYHHMNCDVPKELILNIELYTLRERKGGAVKRRTALSVAWRKARSKKEGINRGVHI